MARLVVSAVTTVSVCACVVVAAVRAHRRGVAHAHYPLQVPAFLGLVDELWVGNRLVEWAIRVEMVTGARAI